MTPAEFAAMCRSAAETLPVRLAEVADTVGSIAKAESKGLIGNANEAWPPLAQSTMDEKARLGYGEAPDFAPLLRTGTLRDSIENVTLNSGTTHTAVVGTDDPIAVYQELGTSKIPPRPFISLGMVRTVPDAQTLLEHVAATLFDGVG